jgi:hypothetical protein
MPNPGASRAKTTGVRIAAQRSMNANSGTALGKNTQRAADSFFAALANASGSSVAASKPVLVAISNVVPQESSESANGDKPAVSRIVSGEIPAEDNRPQPVIASTDAKGGAKEAPAQPTASRSTTGTTQGATSEGQRQHLSSTVLAAKIAAVVVLPSISPLVSVPVTVTAPPSQSVVDGDFSEKGGGSHAGSSPIPTAPGEDRSQLTPRTDAKTAENSQPAAAKPADSRTGVDSDRAAAPQDAPASAPADSSSESTPRAISPTPAPFVNLVLPPISIPPSVEGKSDAANNAAQTIKSPDLSGAKTSESPSSDNAAKTSASQVASTNSSAAGAANTNQAGQHSQINTPQPAPTPAKSADSGAAPTQTVTIQGVPRESTPHEPTAASIAARPTGQPLPAQTADAAAVTAINTARLIQNLNQTEMRVGMHSAEFGEISIRTMVSQQQMTAQISVDHSDLGNAISAHIPAMQEKLGGDTGLKALVQVGQGSMSFSGERGGSSPRQQPSRVAPARIESANMSIETDHPVSRVATWTGSNGRRLDIRA